MFNYYILYVNDRKVLQLVVNGWCTVMYAKSRKKTNWIRKVTGRYETDLKSKWCSQDSNSKAKVQYLTKFSEMENTAEQGNTLRSYLHKWQENVTSGRKSKWSGDLWWVAGIYLRWHNKINFQINKINSRKCTKSCEIWSTCGKNGRFQENGNVIKIKIMFLRIIIHFSVNLRSFTPWHQNHRQFWPFYREITVLLQNLWGLISAVLGLFSAWRSFFHPTAKSGGPYFRLGVFFLCIHPSEKRTPEKRPKCDFRSFFRGDSFRGSFFFRSFFCSRPPNQF